MFGIGMAASREPPSGRGKAPKNGTIESRLLILFFESRNPVVTLTRLDSAQPDFQARLTRLLQFDDATDASIEQTVASILHDVKTRGDAAVLEYTARFDRLPAASLASLELKSSQLQAALESLPADTRQALEAAAERVRRYHEKQVQAFVELHRGRRHHARPASHAARPRRPVCAGRQGGLSLVGADERDSGQGGGRGRTHHGGAHAGRRAERTGAGRRRDCRAWIACSPSAARRRWRRWPTAPRPCRRSTRSSAPATPTWRRPSAACSAWWAST